MPSFTPKPKESEMLRATVHQRAVVSRSVAELRALVAELCDRLAALESAVAKLEVKQP